MFIGQSVKKIGLCCTIPIIGIGLYSAFKWRKTKELIKMKNPTRECVNTDKEVESERFYSLLNEVKPRDLWNTALFFPDKDPEAPGSVTSQFLHYFQEAKYSIHCCAFLLSYLPLSQILLNKFHDGVLIQIITDYDTMDPRAHHNYFNYLKRRGLNVRYMSFGGFMHHKFAVIDEVAVIMGSLNWTRQGIMMNGENVIVTTDQRYVRPYLNEFRKIWLEFRESPFNFINEY